MYLCAKVVKGESNRRKTCFLKIAEPHPIFYKGSESRGQLCGLARKRLPGRILSKTESKVAKAGRQNQARLGLCPRQILFSAKIVNGKSN